MSDSFETIVGKVCLERGWVAKQQFFDCLKECGAALAGPDGTDTPRQLSDVLVSRGYVDKARMEALCKEISDFLVVGKDYAAAQKEDALLRHVLRTEGFATREQVDAALAIQREAASQGGTAPRLAEVLLQEGLIGFDVIVKVLQRQQEQRKVREDSNVKNLIPGYELLGTIGRGGMGAVYKARQIGLDRPVAIKLLRRIMAEDPDFQRRFLLEARTAGKLRHENLVSALDCGEAAGRSYIVMEFVEGRTIADMLRQKKKLPEREALMIVKQVAEGLQYAWEHQVIHRDIKPQNIMVTRDGTAKICDLGLCRDVKALSSHTVTGAIQCTPAYASPEQARGEKGLDTRSDIYSLGTTLYEMVTGEPPFTGISVGDLLIKQATETPPTPLQRNPKLTGRVNQLILRMMEKSKDARPATPGEVAESIGQILAGPTQPIRMLNPGTPSTPMRALPARRDTPAEGADAVAAEAAPESRTFVLAVTMVVMGIFLLAAAVILIRRFALPPSAPPPPPATSSAAPPSAPPESVPAPQPAVVAARPPEPVPIPVVEDRELRDLEARVLAAAEREEFSEALALIEQARPRAAWSSELGRLEREVAARAERLLAPLVVKAAEARRRGSEGDVRAAAARVAAWGLPGPARRLEEELAKVAAPESEERREYPGRWRQALLRLYGREFAAALADLDAARVPREDAELRGEREADRALMESLAKLHEEARGRASKARKDEPLSLAWFDAAGARREAAGRIVRADAERLLLETEGGGAAVVELADLAAAGLEALCVSPDRRALALAYLAEGDASSARRALAGGSLPDKYWSVPVVRRDPAPRRTEAEAQELFNSVELSWSQPLGSVAPLDACRTLLRDYADTAFVRRHAGSIRQKIDAARTFAFFPADLRVRGPVEPGEEKKWPLLVSALDGVNKQGQEVVFEADFHALPDYSYSAWALLGGCCQEVLDVRFQASEAMVRQQSIDPSGSVRGAITAWRNRPPTVKHEGKYPKSPRGLFWARLPIRPAYAAEGRKTIRLISDQMGFSVACIVVGAGLTQEPREEELRAWEKARPEAAAPAGTILWEAWNGVAVKTIPEFTAGPWLRQAPSETRMLTSFSAPVGWGDDFGSRIRGYVHPPETGNYVFRISSDDYSELWLSIDESDEPSHLTSIASVKGYTQPEAYGQYATQASKPVRLERGRRYFIQALHFDLKQVDHLSVAWEIQGQPGAAKPIPGRFLSPFLGGLRRPAAAAAPAEGPGVFWRGLNLGGPALAVDGRAWEGTGAPNVTCRGLEIPAPANLALSPSADAAQSRMLKDFLFDPSGTSVTLSAVPAGTYRVFLYVMEDNAPQKIDVSLQGKKALQGYLTGSAGHWECLGPWAAEVTDGRLEIAASGGNANFCGLEIYKVR